MKYKKLFDSIDQASTALLQAKEGQGNELLSQVFDELLTLSSTFNQETLHVLVQLIEIMHDAQQRRDYVYLVDILQYELPKHISLT
ncbi:hypothetical protein [Colwellia sp. E2M01]|uniref:hypothetical protein n=1 Tax=Colwellia sp. E2M01 TaxID=2841561 RepID=UPI001C08AD5F|nr:hypothetical protein [Colwellia sp. E2M01]MBU2869971.1 hypothetical protein [Colwellia sp. E2M01]